MSLSRPSNSDTLETLIELIEKFITQTLAMIKRNVCFCSL